MKLKTRSYKAFLVLAVTISLVAPIFVSAETGAGIKPSSFFYFLDTAAERVNLFFTFNSGKKAIKALSYADERLAEAVAEGNNVKSVKKAITNYENNIAFAEGKSKDVDDKEKAEALLTSIVDNTSKHQEILTDLLVKVPDEAKEAITKAIEASRKGQEETLKKIAELKGEIDQLKQEVAELKAKDEERETLLEELDKQKIESAPTPNKPLASKTPEVLPTLKPTTSSIKPIAPQTSEIAPIVKSVTPPPQTSEKQDFVKLIYISPSGIQTNEKLIYNPTLNKQEIDVLVDAGWKITDSKLSYPITFGKIKQSDEGATSTSSSVTNTPLEITKASVIPNLTSANIEWETNKLAESKIFLSGDSLSSVVYHSESGLSTRHIVNATGLNSGTTYTYEIESIAGDQVAKKGGSFSTIDKSAIIIKANKTAVSLNAGDSAQISFTVSVLDKAGKYMKDVLVQMNVPPDDLMNIKYNNNYPYHTRYTGSITNSQLNDYNANFAYYPTTSGTKTITFVSGNLSKSITIEVTPYVKVDSTIQDFVNLNPILEKNLVDQTIGSFKLSTADEITSVKRIEYESDISGSNILQIQSAGNGIVYAGANEFSPSIPWRIGSGNDDKFYLQANNPNFSVGEHVITIKKIVLSGQSSGLDRYVSGLPITFTFQVK